jgi:protein-S-isoprenylcysteine O-methyltransferase Ste14
MMTLHVTHGEERSMLERVMAGSTVTERGARVRFPPPLVFLLAILSGVGLGRVRAAEVPIDPPIRIALGLVVLAMGVALIAAARVHFARTGQAPAPWKPSPELILEGPFRFTRNPMYVGLTLVTIGLGDALDDLWISAAAPLALLAVHFIAVLPEERYLSEKFGARYDDYVRRVRRYL